MHSRLIRALFDLLRAADMEIADLPAACNSRRRRSSFSVQSRKGALAPIAAGFLRRNGTVRPGVRATVVRRRGTGLHSGR